METENKNILITGAGGALGRACAEAFVKSGWRVFAADLAAPNIPGAEPLRMDVTSEESVASAAKLVLRSGGLDALLHMAGLFTMDALAEAEPDLLPRMANVNLLGVHRVDRAMLAPLMRRGGRIIITASELAVLDPLPFNGLYSITKRALDAYAHSLSLELDLIGVRVVTLYPGAYGGGMTRASLEAVDRLREKTALYKDIAGRFRRIMEGETGTAKPADALAEKVVRIAERPRPRFRYFMNNSAKLRLFSALPMGVQAFCLRLLLTGGKGPNRRKGE